MVLYKINPRLPDRWVDPQDLPPLMCNPNISSALRLSNQQPPGIESTQNPECQNLLVVPY